MVLTDRSFSPICTFIVRESGGIIIVFMLQVCTIKPGKLLQLSTAIGVARLNNIPVVHEQHTEFKQPKGKLKTGRLHGTNR